jgi:hypothetical protein
MRAVAVPGRWVWGLSGLLAAVALAVPGVRLITTAGLVHRQPPPGTVVRTVTVPQPVTSLSVQSFGGQVRVAAGQVSRVRVTETISYDKQAGGPPAVAQSVSGGRLTLADPVCNTLDCAVSFAVTVPPGVNVTVATDGGPVAVSGARGAQVDSGGGPVTAAGIDGLFTAGTEGGSVAVSGARGAQVDSGGGPLTATGIDGPFTATTNGGSLQLDGQTGPLRADTGGGPLLGQNITAATATVSTGGGSAQIIFAAAPDTVLVSTDGGPVAMILPGGPYALTTGSDGGPQSVGIATDSAARRSITVSSGGGMLRIEAPAGR